MLSLDKATWPEFYGSGDLFYRKPEILPRFLVWLFGSLPTMCWLLTWQLRAKPNEDSESSQPTARLVSGLALVGLPLSALCGVWYYAVSREGFGIRAISALPAPILIIAVAGILLQALGWVRVLRAGSFPGRVLWVIGLGLLATLIGTTLVREAIRSSALETTGLHGYHVQVATGGGLIVFLFFLAINTLLIAWCIRLVRARR